MTTRAFAETDETRWMTLHEVASRHGAYRWTERRLFELTGAWSGAPGVPHAARVHLFEMSAQHSWHAQLWADRLPVLTGVDPDALTRPGGPFLEPVFASLPVPGHVSPGDRDRGAGGDGAGEAVVPFLAGLYEVVLPRLLASYRWHGSALHAVADAPALRALSLVLGDEERQLADGAALLEALVGGGAPGGSQDGRTAAAACVEDLQRLLDDPDGSGPADDLLPWPAAPARGIPG